MQYAVRSVEYAVLGTHLTRNARFACKARVDAEHCLVCVCVCAGAGDDLSCPIPLFPMPYTVSPTHITYPSFSPCPHRCLPPTACPPPPLPPPHRLSRVSSIRSRCWTKRCTSSPSSSPWSRPVTMTRTGERYTLVLHSLQQWQFTL